MNAICLVFDRLHSGYIGAYGNTWIETPGIDRLASQSFLFDQMLIDTPDLNRLYRSYWQGRHALCPEFSPSDQTTLAAYLRERGVTTALVTDEKLVARHQLAVDFDEIIEIDPPWECRSAEKIEQTHFAQCFLRIIDYLQSARQPFMLWCHLAGLGTTWDAPQSFRRAYCDEGDPEPPQDAEVPELMLPEDHDPDELLGMVYSYAGQVSLLDSCLEAFLEFLKDSNASEQLLLAVTSSRGFPLGEHRRIGPCDEPLYGELVQAPLLLRFPDALGAAARSQALVEPADLWATLWQWWQNDAPPTLPASPTAASLMHVVRQDMPAIRDRLCIVGGGEQRAIRTPAWYFRAAEDGELYVKPDDRWEVNNVSTRCLEVVECLQDAILQYTQAIHSGSTADLPPLSDVLIHGLW
jgi:arylsulfatase A-like enzyme